jgi:16S rRNA (uracil1498-N3)-methyltransferase
MIDNLFYIPDTEGVVGSEVLLNEEESNHCIRVSRLGLGNAVHLTDGKGTLFSATIVRAAPKACLLRIEERFDRWGERPYYLHLAVAPTKSPDRYEWMVEKVTEVGIDEITPIISTRSERKVFKTDRVERIAVSAMKQSLKAQLPLIHPATSFDAFIKRPFDGVKMIAHCGAGERVALTEALASLHPKTGEQELPTPRYLILIGPEGDFSPDEVAKAEANGFQPIHLGTSRLRTETAGLAAAMGVYFNIGMPTP